MNTVNASEFKAKCLALLDQVKETGEPLLILKRGKPVAQLSPPTTEGSRIAQDRLAGTVEILGDVMSPALLESDWEVLRD